MTENPPHYNAVPSDRIYRIPLTEEQFLQQIIDLAQATGWLVYHARPARKGLSVAALKAHVECIGGVNVVPLAAILGLLKTVKWRTALQGDVGFPDLVLCRPPVVLFIECKSQGGRVTAGQADWLRFLSLCPHIQTHLWTPQNWPEIEALLTAPREKGERYETHNP